MVKVLKRWQILSDEDKAAEYIYNNLQIHYEFHDNSRWDSWARYAECSTAYQHWIWTAGNHELDFEPSIILVYSGCVETVYGDCNVICTLQPPQEYEEEADATT
ncbi:purple acid phosphatase [Artemisia annua]|uniref:Purple acid phosphatase n=1 Tax=Artemisia annua TaxID=35608 RepID=A0A2U1MRF2_ARTAN|nr:purple acid phosphatase [Artemisia annua]